MIWTGGGGVYLELIINIPGFVLFGASLAQFDLTLTWRIPLFNCKTKIFLLYSLKMTIRLLDVLDFKNYSSFKK